MAHKDFSYSTYSLLLSILLENNYKIISVEDFFNKNYDSGKIVVLRHDIDRRVSKVEKIAKIDSEHNISSSFHFRAGVDSLFKPTIIQKIINLGHTIGYHYEDFANNHGNYEKAILSFENNLAKIRQCYPVITISMHGSTLSKWDNRWLWTKYDYKKYGIIGEPFLDTDFSKVLYLTDTGRKWNNLSVNIRDRVDTSFNLGSLTTFELLEKINKGELPNQIMINSHTNYWTDNSLVWYKILLWQEIKNIFKRIVIKYGLRDRYNKI